MTRSTRSTDSAPVRAWRRARALLLAGLTALLLPGAALAVPSPSPESGWGYPRDVSVDGWRIDWLINITGVFVTILFLIMVAWMLWACLAHGRRHQAEYDHGNGKSNVVTAMVLSIVIFLVVDGNLFINSVIDLREVFWNFGHAESHPDAMRIQVNARQWAWDARYAGPDGQFNTADDIVTTNDIRIPIGVPVIIQLAATDVIHSLYLPNFRQKMDAVPGTITRLWFQARETGSFDIACAEHCGVHHYKMKGTITVLEPEAFRQWAATASALSQLAHDPDDTSSHWGWDWQR